MYIRGGLWKIFEGTESAGVYISFMIHNHNYYSFICLCGPFVIDYCFKGCDKQIFILLEI